jgi:hypothetical protein
MAWPHGLRVPEQVGTALGPQHVFDHVLKPLRRRPACRGWACTLTAIPARQCASRRAGHLEVSRWRGRADPGCTLRWYAHLEDEGVGTVMELPTKSGSRGVVEA